LVTKVKPNINSVEVHPQLRNNGHPVDGVLVGAGSLWPPNNKGKMKNLHVPVAQPQGFQVLT
jgi:hypothetical protein